MTYQHFMDWSKKQNSQKPWLIVGKGPTFEQYTQYNLNDYQLLSLNHVVREIAVDIAHIIDIEVLEDCANALRKNCKFVLMPWHPHQNFKRMTNSLAELTKTHKVLDELQRENRLLYYSLRKKKDSPDNYPFIKVKANSAEAALNNLVAGGYKNIYTLGVDGGKNYATTFQDLNHTTKLANGLESFDIQFEGIADTLRQHPDILYRPLGIEAPIRIYVGCSPSEWISTKILEYSAKRHASMTVEVYPLYESQIPIPVPKDIENRPRTPFSFQRLLIPQLAGFDGHAIYVDSDMQIFTDIKKLWTTPMDSADVIICKEPATSNRRPQFSVMLMDCKALQWHLPDIVAKLDNGELNYEQLMYQMAIAREVKQNLDPSWNDLERYTPGKTALIHYTDMPTQPWTTLKNKNGWIWYQYLKDALAEGFITFEELKHEVKMGHIRPSLFLQMQLGITHLTFLWKILFKIIDLSFTPPYRKKHVKNMQDWLPEQNKFQQGFGAQSYSEAQKQLTTL